MAKGESRKLRMYIPDLNRIVDIELRAGETVPTLLGDGAKRPLLKIDQLATLDGKPRPELSAVLWADSSGQILKQDVDLLGGMTLYRTTEEGAKAPGSPARSVSYDQIRNTIVKVDRVLTNPYQTRYVKYQISLKDADPAEVFPTDARQALQPAGDGRSAALIVQTMGPHDGAAGPATVDAEYLRPNGIVTSGHERVQTLAGRAAGDAVDPWDKAVRINHWVFQNMRSNFETTFAPASEAAVNLSGDCTEHSVLAAAMSRAQGIPSRVVLGLIYVDDPKFPSKGFGFHMWHEVYVNGRWTALDSSFDQSSVDATHIKLSESSLEGVSPFVAFLPILRVQGKVTIDPVEVR